MEQIALGRTGLSAGVAGLGCGGYSRLGAGNDLPPRNAIDIVRRAIDLGVTFIDTSPSYENEPQVGEAIRGLRDKVVLSTKFSTLNKGGAAIDGAAVRTSLEASLRRLGTDHVDVFAIQSVTLATYDHVRDEMLPVLQDLKREGKLRAFGLTEWFYDDTAHSMAARAIADGHWDYLLAGFNMLNPGAKSHILPRAAATGMAVAIMFAVRRALSDRATVSALVRALVAEGRLDAEGIDLDDPLGFLIDDDCASISEAAYRFARHESHGAVVLTGTGNAAHLEANAAAIAKGPLPRAHLDRLASLFGALDSLTGQEAVVDGRIVKKHVAGKPAGH